MQAQHIGRYEIIEELGRGGMATVYLANDPRFDRQVAIKMLPSQFTYDPKFKMRFEREAKTIAGLEHEAIVPVYDFGEFEQQPYLVMRHMAGGSLVERIPAGGMPIKDILPIIKRIAPALDKSHQRGIIHRDLKPGNILFDEDDKAYIADFGVVKLAEVNTTLTTGIVGTPQYMSPEQGEGKEELDGRSDIYALGVIVYQLLSGKLPFEANTPMSLIYAQINEPLPDIQKISPHVSNRIKAVLEKTLAKNREERYLTAQAFVQALEPAVIDGYEALTIDDLVAQKPSPQPSKRRLPLWVWLMAGGLIIVIALLLVGQFNPQPGVVAQVETATSTMIQKLSSTLNPTGTNTPSYTPSPTFTLTPTPVQGFVQFAGNTGAFLRDAPQGAIITSLLNNSLVEILPHAPEQIGNQLWVEVIVLESGERGWIQQRLLVVHTPVQSTETPTATVPSSTATPTATASFTIVPDVEGKALSEAEAILVELGFIVTTESEYNKDVPGNTVLEQYPIAGTALEVGGQVLLKISEPIMLIFSAHREGTIEGVEEYYHLELPTNSWCQVVAYNAEPGDGGLWIYEDIPGGKYSKNINGSPGGDGITNFTTQSEEKYIVRVFGTSSFDFSVFCAP